MMMMKKKTTPTTTTTTAGMMMRTTTISKVTASSSVQPVVVMMMMMFVMMTAVIVRPTAAVFRAVPKDIVFDTPMIKDRHIGRAYYHFSASLFTDVNGDGILDLFTNNHHSAKQFSDPGKYWDLGIGNPFIVNASLEELLSPLAAPWYKSKNEQMIEFEIEYDPDTGKSGRNILRPLDAHGLAVIDIDNDKFLDIYSVTGKDLGTGTGSRWDAVLLWGEKPSRNERKRARKENTTPLQTFYGGRQTAAKSHMEGRNHRGRGVFFLDANNDGKLDLFPLNDLRNDELIEAGILLLQGENRTFHEHRELREYAQVAMVTDADHDGFAQEFLLHRWKCKHDTKQRAETVYSDEWNGFCATRPRGTIGIFKWNFGTDSMEQISETIEVEEESSFTNILAYSLGSGDFDNDGLADQVVVLKDKLLFYYSSILRTQNGTASLPTGSPHESIKFGGDKGTSDECTAETIRLNDYNNDGVIDILLMCNPVDKHRFYTQIYHGAGKDGWIRMEAPDNFGDVLRSAEAANPTDACDFPMNDPPPPNVLDKELKRMCMDLKRGKKHVSPKGVTVADFNNDGSLDLQMAYHMGNVITYLNTWSNFLEQPHSFFALRLEGVVSNFQAIGATVLLTAENMGEYQNETTTQFREITSYSHSEDRSGGREPRVHFGLGPAGIPTQLDVYWPSGLVQSIVNQKLLEGKMNIMNEFPEDAYYNKLLVIKEGNWGDLNYSAESKWAEYVSSGMAAK